MRPRKRPPSLELGVVSGEPNALQRRIAAIIARDGPITIERYWDIALFDREDGYYASRDPFGQAGDFVTAPDVSQMFGELIGAWLVSAWRGLGAPSPFVLCEIGPGRATLMADILRTVGRLDGGFMRAARVALVETSERLAQRQALRLEAFDLPIRHVRRIEDVEAGPLLLVANELFDAVAIRQVVRTEDGWRERCVGVGAQGRLGFVLLEGSSADGDELPSPAGGRRSRQGDEGGSSNGQRRSLPRPPSSACRHLLPEGEKEASPGTVLEHSPQRLAIADAIAARIAAHGGAALAIDYGHAASGYGDTLQAMQDHAFADPLATPGECDITSHVDFAALAARFAAAGLAVAPVMEQGEFLLKLGLAERAGALGRGRSVEEQAAIEAAARRLAGSGRGEMGSLFKVLAVASTPLPLPPFPARSTAPALD